MTIKSLYTSNCRSHNSCYSIGKIQNLCILLFSISLLLFLGCKKVKDDESKQKLQNWNVPQHPYLSSNGKNNVHNDAYMTDVYSIKGPERGNLNLSFLPINRIFITITFDSKGRILTLGTGADSKRAIYLIDAESLNIIDSYELPAGTDLSASGAGYFCLDNHDRMIVPTTNKHIYIFDVAGNPSEFVLETDYDLTSLPDPCHIISVLPDWKGNLWFITEEGIVGIVHEDRTFNVLSLTHNNSNNEIHENIGNSFAVDETGGVFVVSDYALYRLEANDKKEPQIIWREEYSRGNQKKPGQFMQGSGTTPTLISDEYITITDNDEPRMNVLVYRRDRDFKGDRLLCKVPVFKANASATENSLIAFQNSIVVENNYGYTKAADFIGKFTEPGMTRIDFYPDGNYDVAWESDIIVPSVVSKYSSQSNVIYTYTKEPDGWYFTGIDWNTGMKKFQTKAGADEIRYNNHYSGIAIGADGSAYVGCAGGIIRFSE